MEDRDITTTLRRQLSDMHEALAWWTNRQADFADLVEKLQNAGLTVSLSSGGLDVSGSGDKALLITAFKLLRGAGFVPNSRPEATATYFGTYFRHEELSSRSIYFSFSSSVCRRVQIGTELKEVPVYEVQCGESMAVTDEELL